jgi:hypothetical protein
MLLTDHGLSRMVAKGVLTAQEKEVLDMQLNVPKTQKHWIVLQWILCQCTNQEGQYPDQQRDRKRRFRRKHALRQPSSSTGTAAAREQVLLEKISALRSNCHQIQTKTAARMPLPYVQYVRVLVDVFVSTTTVALYNSMGMLAAVAAAVISLFYIGLLELGFSLLDPLDDEEDFRQNSIYLDVAVLLRESTATSQRWINAASNLKG